MQRTAAISLPSRCGTVVASPRCLPYAPFPRKRDPELRALTNASRASQFFVLSTSRFCAIHGIIARSFWPTFSTSCSAPRRRIALKLA